jgi:hypothetical protein
MSACLADTDCRASLDAYARCLGKDCLDNEAKDCTEMKLGLGTPLTKDVALCVLGDCSTACAKGTLAGKCDLYCACMQNYCGSDFSTRWSSTAECLAKCNGLPARDADCRWSHCEYARYAPEFHCPHAVATPTDVCNSVLAPRRQACLDRQESGFPCKVSSNCCSSNCSSGLVCQ